MADETLHIDCDTCIGPAIGACDDCVVTYLLDGDGEAAGGPGRSRAVVIDLAEARALRVLADAALVPGLRHTPDPASAEGV